MKLPSGSKLELASICPPSVVLPSVDFMSRYAARGTVFHEFLYAVATHGLQVALEGAPEEYRENLAALDFDRLPLDPAKYAAEVTWAYDVRTGKVRELGRNISREEMRALRREDEIIGTADVVSLGDGVVTVLDYKTGWTDYGPLKSNWQLSFYALCAARAYDMDKASIGIIRIREDGSHYLDMAELDFFDLEDVAFRLESVVAGVREADEALNSGKFLRLREGEHCRRCPAMARCPAMVALVKELAQSTEADVGSIELTQETAPAIYGKLRAVRAVVERMEATMETWAASSPISLSNGKVYGRTRLPRDVFEPQVAVSILKVDFGADFVGRAVDITPRVTKEGLRRAIRFEAQRNKGMRVEATLRALQERLRAAGGLTTKFTYPVMVHRPKQEEGGVDDSSVAEGPASQPAA